MSKSIERAESGRESCSRYEQLHDQVLVRVRCGVNIQLFKATQWWWVTSVEEVCNESRESRAHATLSEQTQFKFIECNGNVPPMYPPLNVVYVLFAGAVQQL